MKTKLQIIKEHTEKEFVSDGVNVTFQYASAMQEFADQSTAPLEERIKTLEQDYSDLQTRNIQIKEQKTISEEKLSSILSDFELASKMVDSDDNTHYNCAIQKLQSLFSETAINKVFEDFPQNKPLYKDSGLWQLRTDDMEEVIHQQGVNETDCEFFKRCSSQRLSSLSERREDNG
jgi:hypothetical protein